MFLAFSTIAKQGGDVTGDCVAGSTLGYQLCSDLPNCINALMNVIIGVFSCMVQS